MNWKEVTIAVPDYQKGDRTPALLFFGVKTEGVCRCIINRPLTQKMGLDKTNRFRVFITEDGNFLGICADPKGTYNTKLGSFGNCTGRAIVHILNSYGYKVPGRVRLEAISNPEAENPVFAFDIRKLKKAVK